MDIPSKPQLDFGFISSIILAMIAVSISVNLSWVVYFLFKKSLNILLPGYFILFVLPNICKENIEFISYL